MWVMTNGGGGTGVVVADAPTEEAPAMEAADVEEAADVIESKRKKKYARPTRTK